MALQTKTPGSKRLLDYVNYKEPAKPLKMNLLNYLGWRVEETGRERCDDIVTGILPIVAVEPTRSVSQALVEQRTLLTPAIPKMAQRAERASPRDLWAWLVGIVASVVSICATMYYYQHGMTMLYDDTFGHIRIARSVLDNATPGLAQLGAVWLPLPHILMLPFIWDDVLWRTGLAGSFVSMWCYIIACLYLYRFIQRLTHTAPIAFIGTLIFALNPNVLYLQTTPLSELVCIVTLLMATYYFLAWIEEETLANLILGATCTFFATLARYDGWPVFIALSCAIPLVGLIKSYSWLHIRAIWLMFTLIGGMGIALWFAWNRIILGDFLYFQHGIYSSQGHQASLIASHTDYTYHNALASLWFYALTTWDTLGPYIGICALVGLPLIFFCKHRLSFLAIGILFIPFAFYALSMYTGQAVIFVPGAVPHAAPNQFYNDRYGVQMVAACAVLSSLVLALFVRFRKLKAFWYSLFLIGVLAQSVLVAHAGILSVQDASHGISHFQEHPINIYLAHHYQGGNILIDPYFTNDNNLNTDANIDISHDITQGNSGLWQQALAHPEQTVSWIILYSGVKHDLVAKGINPDYQQYFIPVMQESDGLTLYHIRT